MDKLQALFQKLRGKGRPRPPALGLHQPGPGQGPDRLRGQPARRRGLLPRPFPLRLQQPGSGHPGHHRPQAHPVRTDHPARRPHGQAGQPGHHGLRQRGQPMTDDKEQARRRDRVHPRDAARRRGAGPEAARAPGRGCEGARREGRRGRGLAPPQGEAEEEGGRGQGPPSGARRAQGDEPPRAWPTWRTCASASTGSGPSSSSTP
ncbi:MAG: hypothetical protein M0C28_49095 [Candidatus Moduliflexus flocculans]|nr:hypothetical protein [Candidatus Moduliflexus flocculans]